MVKLHFLYKSRKGSAIGLARGRNLFFCQLVIFLTEGLQHTLLAPEIWGKMKAVDKPCDAETSRQCNE